MCSATWSSGLSSEKICDLKVVGAGTIMYLMLHIFKLIGRYFVHKTRLVGLFLCVRCSSGKHRISAAVL